MRLDKEDSSNCKLKRSTNVHESSDSHFFETISRIKSGSDAIEKSISFMTFITLKVTEISHESSRLEFKEKLQHTCLPYQMQKATYHDHWRGVLEAFISDSLKVPKTKFQQNYRHFYLMRGASLAGSIILLQWFFTWFLTCLNFPFDSEDLSCW